LQSPAVKRDESWNADTSCSRGVFHDAAASHIRASLLTDRSRPRTGGPRECPWRDFPTRLRAFFRHARFLFRAKTEADPVREFAEALFPVAAHDILIRHEQPLERLRRFAHAAQRGDLRPVEPEQKINARRVGRVARGL